MSQIRVKLDLSLDQAIRIAATMADDAYECEKRARVFYQSGKPEHSKFYRMLADQSYLIKKTLDLQIGNAKNVYIGGDEDESARS